MGCGGLKAYNTLSLSNPNKSRVNSTRKVLQLAEDMLNVVHSYTWGKEGNKIKLKIGIHYGPVIAGVIGHHKPQFSLIGDTVNTTSRVCSTGEKGSITLSEEAHNQIKHYKDFKFVERIVEVRDKNNYVSFIKFSFIFIGQRQRSSENIQTFEFKGKEGENSDNQKLR
jgi:hypothetical protein